MLQTTVSHITIVAPQAALISIDARGHYTIGKELIDSVIDKIRRVSGKESPFLTSKFGLC